VRGSSEWRARTKPRLGPKGIHAETHWGGGCDREAFERTSWNKRPWQKDVRAPGTHGLEKGTKKKEGNGDTSIPFGKMHPPTRSPILKKNRTKSTDRDHVYGRWFNMIHQKEKGERKKTKTTVPGDWDAPLHPSLGGGGDKKSAPLPGKLDSSGCCPINLGGVYETPKRGGGFQRLSSSRRGGEKEQGLLS